MDIKEACERFDTGVYNDIMLAYIINAMKASNVKKETADNILDAISEELDRFTAAEVVSKYRGYKI